MSPATLLSETVEGVLHHIPGIRDGEPESVHQARVGTRRLRVEVGRDPAAQDRSSSERAGP